MKYRETIQAEYDALFKENPQRWDDPQRDQFVFEVLNGNMKYPPKNALDIGCGSGHLIGYLQWHWPEVAYTGLDLSKVAIQHARKMVHMAKFICGELGKVHVDVFELVILQGVAEHFPDLHRGLTDARSCLAEGGLMYVEVPNCLGYPTSEKREGYRRIAFGSKQFEWHLSRSSWEKELDRANLAILASLQGPNIFSEFVWLLERSKT